MINEAKGMADSSRVDRVVREVLATERAEKANAARMAAETHASANLESQSDTDRSWSEQQATASNLRALSHEQPFAVSNAYHFTRSARRLAVAMGTHARLGSASPLITLAGCDLLRAIAAESEVAVHRLSARDMEVFDSADDFAASTSIAARRPSGEILNSERQVSLDDAHA